LNISIRHLQHFIAVAEELHFRRAAQLVNVAQPALSRSVQTLENELGVQLLARNNRNVRLTAAGKEFLAGCKEVVSITDATINKSIRASQNELGGLNVGYTYIAMCGRLPKILTEFQSTHPDIYIEPHCATSAEQLEKLLHNELDFGFMTNPVENQELESMVFQADSYTVIVSNSHPFANKGSISIQELAQEKLLMCSDAATNYFNQHIYTFFEKAGLEPNAELVAQDHVGVLGLIALGRGVSVATEGYGCIYAKELTTLKLTGVDSKLETIMAWRRDLSFESKEIFRQYVLGNTDTLIPSKPAPELAT